MPERDGPKPVVSLEATKRERLSAAARNEMLQALQTMTRSRAEGRDISTADLAGSFVELTEKSLAPHELREAESMCERFIRDHDLAFLEKALSWNLTAADLDNLPYCRALALAYLEKLRSGS